MGTYIEEQRGFQLSHQFFLISIMGTYIEEQNNDFRNSTNNTAQNYENVNINNLNNNFGSKINELDNKIIIKIPSLFNINKIFIHIYFYLGLFNILLILASMMNNDFQYLGMILAFIFLLLFITLINKSELIIEKQKISFKNKIIEINDIVNISKGKYFNLYNYVDIFVKGKFEPIRIFVKNENDANNLHKLKYF